jgi:ATP-dependent 26S proteasome regulatory subunit
MGFQAGVGPAILTAYEHINSIPSDCHLSIDQAGQRHIHFRLPNASMRRELFALHLPNPDRVQADYAVLAELSKGLSGGDILNVCVNAIYAGSVDSDPAKWAVTQGMIEAEIAKVRKAKAEHSGERKGARRRIGFQPG